MYSAGKTVIVVNRHAGTVRSMGEESVRALIAKAMGDTAEVSFHDGDVIERHIGDLLRTHAPERLIVGGGDGTIASAAALVAGTDTALGILPLGTMNMMAQTVGLPGDLAAALAQLAEAEPRIIDVGRANGRLFLHHVSFGLQPRMVRIRERLGYSSRLTKMMAAVRASLAVLLDPQVRRLGLGVDGTQVELRTPALIVSNNIYENAMMLKQARLDEGILGVYALRPMALPSYLGLAFDLLRGRWRDNMNVQELQGRKVEIRRRLLFGRESRSIKATLDGELVLFDLPLVIASDPAALRMLVPRAAAP